MKANFFLNENNVHKIQLERHKRTTCTRFGHDEGVIVLSTFEIVLNSIISIALLLFNMDLL